MLGFRLEIRFRGYRADRLRPIHGHACSYRDFSSSLLRFSPLLFGLFRVVAVRSGPLNCH